MNKKNLKSYFFLAILATLLSISINQLIFFNVGEVMNSTKIEVSKDFYKNKKAIIFTSTGCIYCKKAKDLLSENKIDFMEVDIKSDRSEMEVYKKALIKLEETRKITPLIIINNTIIKGFNEELIYNNIRIKK